MVCKDTLHGGIEKTHLIYYLDKYHTVNINADPKEKMPYII